MPRSFGLPWKLGPQARDGEWRDTAEGIRGRPVNVAGPLQIPGLVVVGQVGTSHLTIAIIATTLVIIDATAVNSCVGLSGTDSGFGGT